MKYAENMHKTQWGEGDAYREIWLHKAATLSFDYWFKRANCNTDIKFRISVGWPVKRAGRKGEAIGQCFGKGHSEDDHIEIFISPKLSDPIEVLGVLQHELVHAVVGVEHGHGPKFRSCALRVGLCGDMRHTDMRSNFKEWAKSILLDIGPYPHGKMDFSQDSLNGLTKREAPLRKFECQNTEHPHYFCYLTKSVARSYSPPSCGECGLPMNLVQ